MSLLNNYSVTLNIDIDTYQINDQLLNEFVKSGFTEVKSEKVSPPRVKESPVSFECKVLEVRPLGDGGGAGNLVICEVLLIHLSDDLLAP